MLFGDWSPLQKVFVEVCIAEVKHMLLESLQLFVVHLFPILFDVILQDDLQSLISSVHAAHFDLHPQFGDVPLLLFDIQEGWE